MYICILINIVSIYRCIYIYVMAHKWGSIAPPLQMILMDHNPFHHLMQFNIVQSSKQISDHCQPQVQ